MKFKSCWYTKSSKVEASSGCCIRKYQDVYIPQALYQVQRLSQILASYHVHLHFCFRPSGVVFSSINFARFLLVKFLWIIRFVCPSLPLISWHLVHSLLVFSMDVGPLTQLLHRGLSNLYHVILCYVADSYCMCWRNIQDCMWYTSSYPVSDFECTATLPSCLWIAFCSLL